MIDIGMFAALGFLVASLLALLIAPAFWNRAVRLTTRKLESTMPMSLADIQADKDQLRAEFAIELRRIEVALEKAKDKAARELMEANKRRVKIGELSGELDVAKVALEESRNANRVLEQTIKRRLPDMEERLKTAKQLMAELEEANAEFRHTVATQAEALKSARATVHGQKADVERLRATLEGGGARGLGKSDARLEKELQRLNAELSRTREELDASKITREQHEMLRQELAKLANHILTAAKGQSPETPLSMATRPFREVRDLAQALAAYARPMAPETVPIIPPPPSEPNGTNGAAHASMPSAPEPDESAAGPEQAEYSEQAGRFDQTESAPSDMPAEDVETASPAPLGNGDARHGEEAPLAPTEEAAALSTVTNGHTDHTANVAADSGEEPETEASLAGNGDAAHAAHTAYTEPEEVAESQEKREEAEPRESLVRRFATRRGRRHGHKGRGKSLSDRLQNMPAEISER